MTKLSLSRLSLRNFKGVRTFDLIADGDDVEIRGRNGVGKSRLADAIFWLLFDKDSLNRKGFEIKTIINAKGEVEHKQEHEVEAVWDIGAGELLSLRKVYKEIWETKRGGPTQTFSGHTTEHYLDGVPVSKGEYDKRVAVIADEGTFRLLLDPRHFNENLKWQDRRRILLDVCGDVTDAQVIASDPDLADLPGILGKRSVEEHKAVVKERRAKLNEELKVLPVRMDEVQRQLEASPELDAEVLAEKVGLAQSNVDGLQVERASIQAGGGVGAEERKAIRAAEEAMYHLERDSKRQAEEAVSAATAGHRKAVRAVEEAQSSFSAAVAALRAAEADVERLTARVDAKRAEWQQINAREVEAHTPDTCSACRQKLPADQVEAAHARAVEQLNQKKASELEAIQSDGKALRTQLDAAEDILAQRRQDAQAADGHLEAAKATLAATPEPTILPEPEDVKATPAYQALVVEKASAEARLQEAQQGSASAVEAAGMAVIEAQAVLSAAQADLAQAKHRTSLVARIDELDAQHQTCSAEFERLERELHLIETFIRAKVDLLTDRINDSFELARFKLFDVQVNGGLAETCETLVDGVPYSTNLNTGNRINVGIDIRNTLADHYGFWPLVIVDNAESVSDLQPVRGQRIALVHDRTIPHLTVNVAAPEEIAA